jgi:hypothetical protein
MRLYASRKVRGEWGMAHAKLDACSCIRFKWRIKIKKDEGRGGGRLKEYLVTFTFKFFKKWLPGRGILVHCIQHPPQCPNQLQLHL